jgi:hypothetical protein
MACENCVVAGLGGGAQYGFEAVFAGVLGKKAGRLLWLRACGENVEIFFLTN